MTSPRVIVPGATTAITRRTTLRKAFLGPWDPMVQQCWLYALADAQRHTDVAIHHANLMINHEHLVVTASYDNLPEFTRRLHRDVSCAINTLLVHHRYDAPRELFDARASHYQRLCDAAAQASRLVYDHVNCVAARLVERPEHMPGFVFDFARWRQGYIDVKRPPIYFSEDDRVRPEVIRMHVTPPPLLYEAFGGDVERLIYSMNRLSDDAVRRTRQTRSRPALGARAVSRLHPWSEPRSLRERGGRPIPSFSIRASGRAGREQTIRASIEVREFRRAHHKVRIAHRDGQREGRFPFGTYAMRTVHGAPVETKPGADAIVTQPGPLLCDVQARLREHVGGSDDARGRSIRLLEGLREQLEQDAESFEENAGMDFSQTRGRTSVDGDAAVHHAEAITRHRFDQAALHDPTQQSGPAAARRLIVLRDRRMGRPMRQARHVADPPV